MTSLKSVRKRRQQLHARDVRGLAAFCFYPLEEKIYFEPLVKKLKFYTLVAKSDLRFKVHQKWGKIIHHEPVHVG